MSEAKVFLDSIERFNTIGKIKNLHYSVEEVKAQREGLAALVEVESLRGLVVEFGPVVSYLATAEAVLPSGHEWVDKVKAAREEIMRQIADPGVRRSPAFRQDAQRRLANLKKLYIQTYLFFHAKARLGANGDRRKGQLTTDGRLRVLQDLSTIEILPRQDLTEFQSRLTSLQTCFALTERDLDASPVCPHCGYKPATEVTASSADAILDTLDQRLDTITTSWTKTLLDNLEDPTTQGNLDLLKPEDRRLLDGFMNRRTLPDQINQEFLYALREALSGLVKIPIKMEDLRVALFSGGAPSTPLEMKRRFEEYLDGLMRGKEPGKVRIVLE